MWSILFATYDNTIKNCCQLYLTIHVLNIISLCDVARLSFPQFNSFIFSEIRYILAEDNRLIFNCLYFERTDNRLREWLSAKPRNPSLTCCFTERRGGPVPPRPFLPDECNLVVDSEPKKYSCQFFPAHKHKQILSPKRSTIRTYILICILDLLI